MQLLHAADADDVRASATHARAHGVEEVGQIHDVGLLGRIVDDRGAHSLGCSQHHVDGAANRDAVKKDIAADQLISLGVYHAAAVFDVSPQSGKALEMLVKGTAADGASAGIAHFGPRAAAQQCAPQIVAGAQLAAHAIGNLIAPCRARIYRHVMAGNVFHLCAQ